MPIELDRERHLLFSLNVLDEMQDRFGGYDKLSEALSGKDTFKNVKWLLARLLNEGAGPEEEELTEAQVGKMVHAGNLNEIINTIYSAFSMGTVGTPEPEAVEDPDDTEEPEEKNGTGARDE